MGLLEQEDVAQRTTQFAKPFALCGDLAPDGEQYQREVGPGGLPIQHLQDLGDDVSDQGLFGDDGGSSALFDFAGHLGDRTGGVERQACALQQPGNQVAVPARGGQDDGAAVRQNRIIFPQTGCHPKRLTLRGISVLR